MKVNYPFKDELVNEIDFIRKRMLNNSKPRKRIFYYSGLFGITKRLMNLKYNEHLQFAHSIFNNTYQQLLSRYQIYSSGDETIPLSHQIFDKIILYLEDITEKIQNDEDIFIELQKIVNIVFLSTGNGYYLKDKGMIKDI